MQPKWSSENVILGSCAAAALLALLPWYSVSVRSGNAEMNQFLSEAGGSTNALGVVEGVLAFLAILATGGLILADRAGALPWSRKARLLAPFASIAGAFVFMLFFMTRGGSFSMGGMSAGRTFWFYLALIAVAVGGFHAWQRWMQGAQDSDSGAPPADGLAAGAD